MSRVLRICIKLLWFNHNKLLWLSIKGVAMFFGYTLEECVLFFCLLITVSIDVFLIPRIYNYLNNKKTFPGVHEILEERESMFEQLIKMVRTCIDRMSDTYNKKTGANLRLNPTT